MTTFVQLIDDSSNSLSPTTVSSWIGEIGTLLIKDNDDKVDQLENCNAFLAGILVDSPAAHESGGEVLDASTDKDSISSNDTDDDPKEKKHSNVMEPVAGWLRGAFLLSIEALRIMRVAIKYEKVVKVLVINANSGPGLLFPKGGWENDETVEEAAAREALEEAGVGGDLLVLGLMGNMCNASE
ncbi:DIPHOSPHOINOSITOL POLYPHOSPHATE PHOSPHOHYDROLASE [Salix purpurea]|uniref:DIPHOSPHOINOSITOL POLYPHOSPHATE PHOSPHOHYDROLASE n=1 Tax=Salix purpurea TaxID=77065 RepID=A0A9Q0VWV3_SALPP|nr:DIPHOSPHOINOSITOL POLYPHOSPHATE PHOSPHOHYDROLASE [Salix purpurea]